MISDAPGSRRSCRYVADPAAADQNAGSECVDEGGVGRGSGMAVEDREHNVVESSAVPQRRGERVRDGGRVVAEHPATPGAQDELAMTMGGGHVEDAGCPAVQDARDIGEV